MQLARDFFADEGLEAEGVLKVHRGFQSVHMRKKNRQLDAQSFALGLDTGDHLVAQSVDVGVDHELGLDPLLDAVLALEQAGDFLEPLE